MSAGTGPIDELGPPVHRLGDLSYDTPGGSNNVTFTSELAAAAGPSFTPRMVGGTQAPPSSLNRSIHAPESRSAGVPVPSAYEQFDELGWIVDLSSRIRAALVGGTAEAASTSSSPTERRRTARVSRPSQDFLELEREIKRRKLAALNASQLRDEDVFGVSAEVGGEELDSIHSSGKGKGKSKAEGLSAEEWAKQAQRDFEARKAAEVAGAAALAEASRTSVAVQTSPPTLRPQNLPNSFMNGFMLPSSQAAAAAADAGPIAGGEDPAATRAALAARAVQEMLAGGGVDTEDGEEAIDLSELFASTGSATGLTGLSQGGQQTPSALFSALGTREGEGEPFDFEQILRARAGLVGLGAQDEEEEEEDGEEEEEGDHEMEDIANRQGAGPTRKALIEVCIALADRSMA